MEVSSSGYDSGASASSSARKQPIALWPGIPDSPATAVLSEIRSRIFEGFLMRGSPRRFRCSPKPRRRVGPTLGTISPLISHSERTTGILGTRSHSENSSKILMLSPSPFQSSTVQTMIARHSRCFWLLLPLKKLRRRNHSVLMLICIYLVLLLGLAIRLLKFNLTSLSLERLMLRSLLVGMVIIRQSKRMLMFRSLLDIAEATDSALTANFIFVACDYRTGKAVPVNRINPETEREKLLHEVAEARYILRKSNVMQIGVKRFESPLTERLKYKPRRNGRYHYFDTSESDDEDPPLPITSMYLKDTCLQNSLIFQPQQRNIRGRIYGGFLMHKAFELAFSTAYAFSGMTPSFLNVDRVDFPSPVNLGDFLLLRSLVLYTENDDSYQPLIHVEVSAQVTRPNCYIHYRSSEVANMFHFTFALRRDPNAMEGRQMIRKIVLETRQEARRVIQRMNADGFQ